MNEKLIQIMNLFLLFSTINLLSINCTQSFFGKKESLNSNIDHEVAWYAPFYSGGGYCSEARSYIQSLISIGYTNFTIHQHGDSWNQNYIQGQNQIENQLMSQYDNTYFQRPFTSRYALINICHSEPGAWYVPRPNYQTFKCPDCSPSSKCYKIGRTMFETDSIPSGWPARLNQMDEIWVPTNQSKEIFIQAGIPLSKLYVIEETVDTEFYSKIDQPQQSLLKKRKTFQPLLDRYPLLSTMNRNEIFLFLFVGKFEERKGIELLIRAYFEEFIQQDDSVMLLLLTSAYHSSNDFENKVEEIKNKYGLAGNDQPFASTPPYLILTDIHQDAMPIIYSLVHALVIPSHGEGWGRPHMEAMACETPVIATDWSGPTAFMNNEVAYMIPINGLIDSPSWKGHKWADPSLSELKKIMRHVYTHREEAVNKGQKAREHILKHFSFEKVGNKLLSQFNRIKILLQQRDPEEQQINGKVKDAEL